MPQTYRRFWEVPDTTTTADPGSPEIKQPEPLPWWEAEEEIANSFPPMAAPPIPAPLAAPELPSTEPPSGLPPEPITPSEEQFTEGVTTPIPLMPPQGPGINIPGVSEALARRMREEGIQQPVPMPPTGRGLEERILAPSPLARPSIESPLPPPRTPEGYQTIPSPGLYIPGVSERLWLNRIQDTETRAELEQLLNVPPFPTQAPPRQARSLTDDEVLSARADIYRSAPIATFSNMPGTEMIMPGPSLLGSMLLMAQVSNGVGEALEGIHSQKDLESRLGEALGVGFEFLLTPGRPAANILAALGAEAEREGKIVGKYFDRFEPIDRVWQQISEPLAGLATLSLYYNQAGRDALKMPDNVKAAILKLDPTASPLEALWHAGQVIYDEAPMPFVTGALQEAINPVNSLGLGAGAGLAGFAKMPALPLAFRAGNLAKAFSGGLGALAQSARQLPRTTREILAEAGGISKDLLKGERGGIGHTGDIRAGAGGLEPWEMTKAEFLAQHTDPPPAAGVTGADTAQEKLVQALRRKEAAEDAYDATAITSPDPETGGTIKRTSASGPEWDALVKASQDVEIAKGELARAQTATRRITPSREGQAIEGGASLPPEAPIPPAMEQLSEIAKNEGQGVRDGVEAFWRNGVGTIEAHRSERTASIRLTGLTDTQVAELQAGQAAGNYKFDYRPDFPLDPYATVDIPIHAGSSEQDIADAFQFVADNLKVGGKGMENWERVHERIVKEAVTEGHPVSSNVLADYPHLEKLANSGKTYSWKPTRTVGDLKVLSDDHLRGEADYLPKQYAGEELPVSDRVEKVAVPIQQPKETLTQYRNRLFAEINKGIEPGANRPAFMDGRYLNMRNLRDRIKRAEDYLAAGEEAAIPVRQQGTSLTLSVNATHPTAVIGQTLYDVETSLSNTAVFRSLDDLSLFRPEGAAGGAGGAGGEASTQDILDALRSAGFDSVYIPHADGQSGWLILLDPKKATFSNPREVTQELLEKMQNRALVLRDKSEIIKTEAGTKLDEVGGAGRGAGGSSGGGGRGGSGYRELPGGPEPPDYSNLTTAFGKDNKPFDVGAWYSNTTRQIQEMFADGMAGVNGLVKNWENAHPGQKIPLRMYSEALVSAAYGAPEAGLSHVKGMTTRLDKIMGGRRGWKGGREQLETYLHLQNALDIWKYLPDHAVSGNIDGPDQARQLLATMRQSIGEDNWAKLEEGARLIIRVQDQLLQRLVDEGIVDKNVARDIRFRLPHYTSTVIIKEHEGLSGVKGAASWVRRYTELGTTEPRYSPIESVIQSLMMGEARIAQNKARRAVALMAEDLGMGRHVKRPNMPVAQLTAKEAEAGEGKLIFRPPTSKFDISKKEGWTYFEGGKQRTFEASPEYRWLADEVDRLAGTSDLTNPLNFVRHANEVFRAGLTAYSPAWWLTNFMRDFYTTFITNRVSPIESAKSLVAAVNHVFGSGDALLTDLEQRGIGMTGFHGRNPDEVARLAERHGAVVLRDFGEILGKRLSGGPVDKLKGLAGLQWDGMMNLHDFISGIGRSIELANRRATASTLMRRRGILPMEIADKQMQFIAQAGVDLEKSLAEITMLTRRSTIDFRRGGTVTRALSPILLFLNAGTQGMLIPGRAIKIAIEQRDYGQLAWMAGSLTSTVVASQAWNKQMAEQLGNQYGMSADDILAEVPPDVKAGTLWFLLPPDQFDPETGRPKPRFLALVPRLSEWSGLVGTANYITDKIAGRDREGFGTLFKNVASQTFPLDSPFEFMPTQIGKLSMEINNNHDYFRDRPIIPEELMARPKAEQFDEYTPQVIIDFSKKHDLSPLMVWHVISSLGSGARSLIRTIDYASGGRTTDPRIQELANGLIAIGPDRVSRNTYLGSLTKVDQQDVLDAEKLTTRPATPPFIGDIVGSVIRTRTGGRRVIGRERAEKATGFSADQTSEVGRELAQFARLQDDKRLIDEKAMDAGALTWEDWFNREQMRGFSLREKVDELRLQFPKAAQIQKDPQAYKTWAAAMATLSGVVTDPRTLGQLLNVEWHTIPMTYKTIYTEDGDKIEGQPDFETFFQWRKEFLDHLTPLEQDAFDSERLSHMTPKEREWEEVSKKLDGYFRIKSEVGGRHPEWRGREYAANNAVTGSSLYKDITNHPEYKEWQRLTSKEKGFYRLEHPEIDRLLVTYGLASKTMREQVQDRAVAMDERIIKQEKVVVERTNNYRAAGTTTAAKSLLTAQNNLEELRGEKDALLTQLDHPETAREIKPPHGPRPGQLPSESFLKYQIAVSKYRKPYGEDPWIDAQVDEFLTRLNDLTFDRSKGTKLRWAELSGEDKKKIEAEAGTKFRWKVLQKQPMPQFPRPAREPFLAATGTEGAGIGGSP